MEKKKVLVGGISLIIGFSCLAFISKPTYQEVNINDLNKESLAVYIKNEAGSYEKSNDIPTSGYVLNEEKSTCNNNAKVSWNKANNSLKIKDLSSNTSCYLYFDKKNTETINTIFGPIEVQPTPPDFSKTSCKSGCEEATVGIYKAEDGMYGGDSYYWRGDTEDNYVKFAGFCWRIVRINGDGSIRLIYDGTTCHDNGASIAESIVQKVKYNSNYNNSSYVGWTYTAGTQRTLSGESSNAKSQLESWYSSNITGINANKVADGKYCNDRNVKSGQTWSATGTTFNYAGGYRLWNKYTPSLSCDAGDTYILKVGLISADEVEFAGGGNNNFSYYLYNGQYYWTMSPSYWDGSSAYVIAVTSDDHFVSWNVNGASVFSTYPGLRPVINLASDIQIKAGTDGTLNNPYVVED